MLGTWAATAAELQLTIRDAATGRAVPARVRVRTPEGHDVVPVGAVGIPLREDRWFASPGTSVLQVPAGEIDLRVERGKEYVPAKVKLTAKPGGPTRHTVKLRRWIDMERLGYVSGENHIHVALSDLPAVLAADDMDYGSSLYWWNGPNLPKPEGAESVRTLSFGGESVSASVFDAEVEQEWGPAYLIGLTSPLPPDKDPASPNLRYLKEGRRQGALLCYNAGWAREALVDALAGYVDVVDICNNLFLRHRFLPRKGYSNVLGVEGLPQYEETPAGMLQMNLDAYYRMLNCGLRVAAGADSAVGAKATPVGYNRAYVRAKKGAPLADFLDAWRRGRNFVTNGPMVFLESGSHGPGDVVDLPSAGKSVRLRARAMSDEPLKSLELVANGEVIARASIRPGDRSAGLSHTLTVSEGTWVAARCSDEEMLLSDEELARYRRPPGRPAEEPSRLRFGHTSPIYLTVAGRPVRVAKSVEEARRIVDAFERFARGKSGDRFAAEVQPMIEAARSRLQ